MGYTTYFEGSIVVTPALSPEFIKRWNKATEGTPGKGFTRSCANGVEETPDMLPGFEGAKPQTWCHWQLTSIGNATYIDWDGGEKFYDYIEWLQFLVAAIRKVEPRAEFEGLIEWDGEGHGDTGVLRVNADGQVEVGHAPMTAFVWQEA